MTYQKDKEKGLSKGQVKCLIKRNKENDLSKKDKENVFSKRTQPVG